MACACQLPLTGQSGQAGKSEIWRSGPVLASSGVRARLAAPRAKVISGRRLTVRGPRARGMAEEAGVSAAILVIGDEILSGRTKDKNIGYIADYLAQIGIDLREVRIVPDVEDDIVDGLNALRHRYTYVFTTGGIGPTHDDITADAVANAFGVPTVVDPRAIPLLLDRIKPQDI